MMFKKIIYGLLSMCAFLLVSCEKAPLNADVEGHWVLERFTLLETGEMVPCEHLYYGITRMVTEVARKAGDAEDVAFVARTEYKEHETILELSQFKVNGYNTDTGVNATPEQLLPFGIENAETTSFLIVNVTQKEMVLESDYARLQLKRF